MRDELVPHASVTKNAHRMTNVHNPSDPRPLPKRVSNASHTICSAGFTERANGPPRALLKSTVEYTIAARKKKPRTAELSTASTMPRGDATDEFIVSSLRCALESYPVNTQHACSSPTKKMYGFTAFSPSADEVIPFPPALMTAEETNGPLALPCKMVSPGGAAWS